MRPVLVAAALLLVVLSVSANTYTVSTTADAGPGSLRRAIADANRHLGADRITFAHTLSGSTISLANVLPKLKDDGTTIDGDLNNDGKPDIGVYGAFFNGWGIVLEVDGDNCVLTGLAIGALNGLPLVIGEASQCKVTACHVGVNLAGSAVLGTGGLFLSGADHCTVGGPTAKQRNILAPALVGEAPAAVAIIDGASNTVIGNYIGLTRGGGQALGSMGYGVLLLGEGGLCTQNRIGGAGAGQGNRFGGLTYGIGVMGAVITGNTIAGNTFGLLANGNDPAPIQTAGIYLFGASIPGAVASNTIGGSVAGARNVFANCPVGISIGSAGTTDNRIQGNWFGSNAVGKAYRPLTKGIEILESAGRQTIGGPQPASGNYFTPTAPRGVYTFGVAASAGGGSTIRSNTFGRLPNGTPVGPSCGVALVSVSAAITDNLFDSARVGINVAGAGANPGIYRNRFEDCRTGVDIVGDGRCCLGDLGNSASADNGGNVFRLPLLLRNVYAVRNDSSGAIKAEGNDWNATTKALINAVIWDKLDDSALGLVDYDPIQGGVHPTGGILRVSATVATPTSAGAEIAFTLSSPAEVSVSILNLAGRVVAVPVHDRPCAAGTQRLLWNGHDAAGLRVPAGRYLARIEARRSGGAQAAVVCPLTR
jgi:hypothetical protein